MADRIAVMNHGVVDQIAGLIDDRRTNYRGIVNRVGPLTLTNSIDSIEKLVFHL